MSMPATRDQPKSSQVAVNRLTANNPRDDLDTVRCRLAPHVATLVVSLLILSAAGVLDITEKDEVVVPVIHGTLPPTCWFRTLTGQACAGCGLTRAFIELAHGDWLAAWCRQTIALPLFLLVSFQVPMQLWQIGRLSRGRAPWRRPEAWSLFTLVAIVIALYLGWVVQLVGPWLAHTVFTNG